MMFFLARKAEPSAGHDALTNGFICGCFSLAGFSMFERVSGHAGIGILSAVIVEVLLGAGFIAAMRRDAKATDGLSISNWPYDLPGKSMLGPYRAVGRIGGDGAAQCIEFGRCQRHWAPFAEHCEIHIGDR